MRLSHELAILGIAATFIQCAFSFSYLDYSPDLSKSKRVYPPVEGDDLTGKNVRGTKLFGFDGCSGPDQNDIIQAYKDMNKVASTDGVGSGIDWNTQHAKEFFGAANGNFKIPDDRRASIQQVMNKVSQIWSYPWPIDRSDPLFPWLHLWVWVRCSGGDNSGDPEDGCKDKTPNNGQCGVPPVRTPLNDQSNRMQAYSNPLGESYWGAKYTRVTFCRAFFDLPALDDIITESKGSSWDDVERNTLDGYDNQARVFFHEATHWNYFVDADGQGTPYIDDLTIKFKKKGIPTNDEAYGPANCKILTNYRKRGKGGFYTQRNADTYAWFALAQYLKTKIGFYPTLPKSGSTEPMEPPRDGDGNPLFADTDTTGGSEPKTSDDADGGTGDGDPGKVKTPRPRAGCNGKWGGGGSSIPILELKVSNGPKCDLNKGSGLPTLLFNSKFYEPLCTYLKTHSGNGNQPFLSVIGRTVNAVNDVTPPPKGAIFARSFDSRVIGKRSPPLDPKNYPNYRVVMKWTVGELVQKTYTKYACTPSLDCTQAFTQITSRCGAAGSPNVELAQSTTLDVGCGSYSLDVVKV